MAVSQMADACLQKKARLVFVLPWFVRVSTAIMHARALLSVYKHEP